MRKRKSADDLMIDELVCRARDAKGAYPVEALLDDFAAAAGLTGIRRRWMLEEILEDQILAHAGACADGKEEER